jgi:CelD/BcsL family acetyltransferase involved in cellulose biosynthesis
LNLTLNSLPNDLRRQWCDLEACSDGSFFTSWLWIGSWIESHSADSAGRPLRLLTVEQAGRIVALAIVGEGKPGVLRRSPFLLHESGSAADSARFIEYNDILVHRAAPADTRAQVFAFLGHMARSIRISGATPTVHEALGQSGLMVQIDRRRACPWVPLDRLAPDLEAYLATLGRNTRQQIRRSIRLVESSGPIALKRASSVIEARQWFAELKRLHVARWQKRDGTAGAFAWKGFEPFALALIEAGAAGSVDVLNVTAGSTVVGVLLNFVHRGHVYAYQNGFTYSDDSRLKPGLVSHALAVAHYRQQGCSAYHFMAGDGRYKTSLGRETEELSWLRVHDNSLPSRIESALCALKRRSTSFLRGLARPNR